MSPLVSPVKFTKKPRCHLRPLLRRDGRCVRPLCSMDRNICAESRWTMILTGSPCQYLLKFSESVTSESRVALADVAVFLGFVQKINIRHRR